MVVEWRKWGSYARVWRNSPSFLDGFAMSRFLAAMGERFDIVSQHILSPVVLKDRLNEWHTVGGKQLDFYLHGPSTALFTYGLPVTQVSQLIKSSNLCNFYILELVMYRSEIQLTFILSLRAPVKHNDGYIYGRFSCLFSRGA